jgi:hypothetical protein
MAMLGRKEQMGMNTVKARFVGLWAKSAFQTYVADVVIYLLLGCMIGLFIVGSSDLIDDIMHIPH